MKRISLKRALLIAEDLIRRGAVEKGVSKAQLVGALMRGSEKQEEQPFIKQIVREVKTNQDLGDTMKFKQRNIKRWNLKLGIDESNNLRIYNKTANKRVKLDFKEATKVMAKSTMDRKKEELIDAPMSDSDMMAEAGLRVLEIELNRIKAAAHTMEFDMMQFIREKWGETYAQMTIKSELEGDWDAIALRWVNDKNKDWLIKVNELTRFLDKVSNIDTIPLVRLDVAAIYGGLQDFRNFTESIKSKGIAFDKSLSTTGYQLKDEILEQVHREGLEKLHSIIGDIQDLKSNLRNAKIIKAKSKEN